MRKLNINDNKFTLNPFSCVMKPLMFPKFTNSSRFDTKNAHKCTSCPSIQILEGNKRL